MKKKYNFILENCVRNNFILENWARSTENDMKVVSSERQLKRDSSDLISC